MNLLKSIAFVVLAGAGILFSGCGKNNSENLTVNIAAVYGSQNFALNTPYTDPTGRKLKLSSVKFYLSHIKLVKSDNSETELKDVVLVDMSNANSLKLNLTGVSGDFTALKFGLGVDSAQNTTDPLAAPSSSPLSIDNCSDLYWSMLKYMFQSFEGKSDTTTSGTPTFNMGLTYHTGENIRYNTVTLAKTFSVGNGKAATLNLTLDIKKIFNGDTQNIDIVTERVTNTDDYPAIATKFASNFSKAFTLN